MSELDDKIFLVGYYYFCKNDLVGATGIIDGDKRLKDFAWKWFDAAAWWDIHEDKGFSDYVSGNRIIYEAKTDELMNYMLMTLGGYTAGEVVELKKCPEWAETRAIALGLKM